MLRNAVLSSAGLAMPLLRLLPAEQAHDTTLRALRSGFAPKVVRADDPILGSTIWGYSFPNPVGLAAGFDKNAEVADPLLRWGFGFAEIGTVTPRPQSGNPKPRLFRLSADRAIINRMGFNNAGLGQVAARLTKRTRSGIVGANLGKNRDSVDATADYCRGVASLAPLADYLVINVSSPNTPGLRDLQKRSAVRALLEAVLEARDAVRLDHPPPILLKIAPDLRPDEVADIAVEALAAGIDGLIISNTTTARPATLKSQHAPEPGGLSGRPLFESSTQLLAEIYRLTKGTIPLIGVGGISSGADAYTKIKAGASLVQLYTALVYGGPGMVRQIKLDLAALLRRDGFNSVIEAIGISSGLTSPPRSSAGGTKTGRTSSGEHSRGA